MTAAPKTGQKRGNGEGSVRQRPDGTWEARLTLPDGARRSFYAKTRAEAARKLASAQGTVQQGLPLPAGRMTVGAFLTDWLTNTVKPSVRPRTYQSYDAVVRLHLVPTLGTLPLQSLSPQRIQALLNSKTADGFSPRSVAYIRAVLRIALNQALAWNLIARNPAPLVKPPKAKKHTMTVFTPEHARQFLDAVRGDRLEALYTVALALGLRRGEALGLQWRDIDIDAGTLTIAHQLQRVGGTLTLTEPKSYESRRTLILPAVALDALRQHRIRQLEEQLALGGAWRGSGFVFTSTIGTPLDERNVSRMFKRLLTSAGLPDMRFHDLRHSAASLLLAQGVSAKMVQELLGHSNISLTLGTYSHVIPQLARDTADRMNAVLTGTALG